MVELSDKQQIEMLRLARNTIADSLSIENDPSEMDLDDEVYKNICGAFVTLHIKGNLRGCIGNIVGTKQIPETVAEMAKSSAFRDPWFNPLGKEEYSNIDIEISILSPIETVNDVSEIVVGRDGVIISRGYNSGLLLPQVATEQGWDRDTFIEHTCHKAGLPGNAWQDPDTKIEKFSAQVFGEIEFGLL